MVLPPTSLQTRLGHKIAGYHESEHNGHGNFEGFINDLFEGMRLTVYNLGFL